MKIFINDLELAIQKQGNIEFKLDDSNDNAFDSLTLKNYITEHYKIKSDFKEIDLDFVGYEFNDDAIVCYFEGGKLKKINVIEIENTILLEIYDDQINLSHFQYNGKKKSIKTTRGNATEIIDTTSW